MMNGVDLSNKDILIVDDNPDNLRILSSILLGWGCKVRKALSGQMALKICETVSPDLILLDIMMPEMDGYAVCQQLKALPHTANVPVIFISALNEAIDKVKAFDVGGVDYISKPFQVEEVLIRIAHQLRIRQLTEELQRSNADLEQFAYIASHDLQSPLQAIVGNADLLSWKYEGRLGADGDRYVEQIIQSAFRMKQLIEDLLDYSRIGTASRRWSTIDCQEVLAAALSNLSAEIAQSDARITHSELPTILGDRTQLMQLFQNLIGNAIKFRRRDVIPTIEISATPHHQSEWLLEVKDNGIGIESQQCDRIFEVFQRLHSTGEYPGTGIGLTICKKIVERHGGKIWVDSQLGCGTQFYFTLPQT